MFFFIDGEDFTGFTDMPVVFPAMSGPGTRMTVMVAITDDLNVELTESFNLAVRSDDTTAELSPASAACFISDNDSKSLIHGEIEGEIFINGCGFG